MARAREGWGRHRQPYMDIICPACHLLVQARRAKVGRLHVRAHLNEEMEWCPCTTVTGVVRA
jgi:hypothetical protein